MLNLLDPKSGRRAPVTESKTSTRKPRQVKVYKKPHTGEVVETKGGNHKTLKGKRNTAPRPLSPG